MSELSLWLDNYDDIYSDFDSRHYLKRRISEDFMHELRMTRKYRNESVADLLLLLPESKRREESERIIVTSLKAFFTEQFHASADKCRKKFGFGIRLLSLGIVVMMINSYINFRGLHSFGLSALTLLLEPGGWFLLWSGFDSLFYDLRELKKEKEFFGDFSEMNIHFRSS